MADGHEHRILHRPKGSTGWAVCECGATLRIEAGEPVGSWHACRSCTHPWGLLVVLLALLLPGVVTAETLRGVPRVVDGDTVEVAGERVRLFGIDAPELGQVCRRVSGTEWHCGWASAVLLEEEVAGRPVRCEGIERDRYGRLVARCFVGAPGVDLGGWLVARGLAVAYRKYSTAYVGQEGAARADRVGLWSGAFVAPWDWRKGVR